MTPSYRRKPKSTRKSSSSSSRRGSCQNKTKQYFLRSKNVENTAVSPSNSANSTSKLEAEANICSTPKAERFRIPEISTCPPAPKKRRISAAAATAAAACSLRRTPLVFFAHPDIEVFFYFALRGIPV